MASPEPLWRALRHALAEKDLSVRRAAKELHAFDGRQKESSWKRTLNRALDPDSSYVFQEDTAEVLARFFGKPADFFVRQQQRETQAEEIRRLAAENRRLEAESAELRRRLGIDEPSHGSA